MVKYVDGCSGISAPTVAWRGLGWACVAYAEVDPFACAVLAQRFGAGEPRNMPAPEDAADEKNRRLRAAAIRIVAAYQEWGDLIPNLGDFARLREAPELLVEADVFVAGTPCFTAGTLILTRRGLVPIEAVKIGEEVLTHEQRWRPVTATMSREADTIIVKGQGHWGIETTADHPFWARDRSVRYLRGPKRRLTPFFERVFGPPRWVDAQNLCGKFWSTPGMIPLEPRVGDAAFLRFVGRWLGDGWLRTSLRRDRPRGQRVGAVLLCGAHSERAELAALISAAGYTASPCDQRTAVRFTIYSKQLTAWLEENFGRGAATKTIPTWIFCQPADLRWAFLAGLLSADGHRFKGGTRLTTTSRAVAVGARLLATSLGKSCSISRTEPKGGRRIEGRLVNERPYYVVSIYDKARSSIFGDGFAWGLVRSVRSGRRAPVFNIEVAEDNSYVADGLVVHNCQAFSLAGLRRGLADERGNLTLEYVRTADAIDDLRRDAGRPEAVHLWENVPGVFSTEGNPFGTFLAGMVGSERPIVPPQGRSWTSSGVVAGPRRVAAWRELDAQHFGLPQRRRRVFVLSRGGPRAWAVADALLPVIESVSGHPAPRRRAGQGSPASAEAGARGAGGKGRRDVGSGPGGDGGAERPPGGRAAFGGNNTAGPIDVATARLAHGGAHGHQDFETETFVVEDQPDLYSIMPMQSGTNFKARKMDVAQPVMAGGPVTGAQGGDYVVQPIPFDTTQLTHPENRSNPQPGDPAPTLARDGHAPSIAYVPEVGATLSVGGKSGGSYSGQDAMNANLVAHAFSMRGRNGESVVEPEPDDVAPALRTGAGGSDKPFVGYNITPETGGSFGGRATEVGVAPTTTAEQGEQTGRGLHLVEPMKSAVRRLTPRECERLMGFPDDFSLIEWSDARRTDEDLEETVAYLKAAGYGDNEARVLAATPDGPRYRVCGNSQAVNVMAELGRRIEAMLADG